MIILYHKNVNSILIQLLSGQNRGTGPEHEEDPIESPQGCHFAVAGHQDFLGSCFGILFELP